MPSAGGLPVPRAGRASKTHVLFSCPKLSCYKEVETSVVSFLTQVWMLLSMQSSHTGLAGLPQRPGGSHVPTVQKQE